MKKQLFTFLITLFSTISLVAQQRTAVLIQVRDIGSKRPIEGVTVSIEETWGDKKTQRNGRVYFDSVRIGQNTVMLEKEGYVFQSREVNFSPDKDLNALTFELTKSRPDQIYVWGTIKANGKYVRGVSVTLRMGKQNFTGTTDKDGFYAFQVAKEMLKSPSYIVINDPAFALKEVAINLFHDEDEKRVDPIELIPHGGGKGIYPLVDTTTKTISNSVCRDNYGYYNGEYCFVNNYGEDIVIYTYITNNRYYDNVMIADGESNCVFGIRCGWNSKGDYSGKDEVTSMLSTFYIKTSDDSKPIRYGIIKLVTEACKRKTIVLTKSNLYLSVDGIRR